MTLIHNEWQKEDQDYILLMPDNSETSFSIEMKIFALDAVCHFFKQFLKNKRIELAFDMFPVYHDIISRIAKMYYETNNEEFRENAMDILSFVNTSEKYARLLENVQHPANENIYIESKRMAAAQTATEGVGGESGQKSSLLNAKMIQLAYSPAMLEQKEREFEQLVLWVTNIDHRINYIMSNQAKDSTDTFNANAFKNVSYNPIVSAFMSLLDSKCMSKEMHITGLTLIRKIIEVENKELTSPAADWGGEDWQEYEKIIGAKQNSLVEIGCIEFLCKHLQDIDETEEEIIE